MEKLSINIENSKMFINESVFSEYSQKSLVALKELEGRNGKGNDYLGWLDLPYSEEYKDIDTFASEFRKKVDIVVIVGIGGSYLGARAVISLFVDSFEKGKPEVLYAGNSLDETYHGELIKYLKNKNFGVIVISKSGTTTEPAIAFRLLKGIIESKYGKEEASKRIIAITDEKRGALKKLALKENYKTFTIPDNVGGRFSIFTPVGLLPLALAGINIEQLLLGARQLDKNTKSSISIDSNALLKYATVRNALYSNGKKIELLTSYNPKLFYLIEWWKQLFGESEGKEGKGIFPAGIINTTDLHSLGQYVQEGERIVFETVLEIKKNKNSLKIPESIENLDNLNYLAGKDMSYVNKKAKEGTLLAHLDGGVPNISINLPELNEYFIGQLLFFFEKSCAVSGYTLGVNPFDQPGVEAYKSKMFKLLEKPS